MAKILLLQLIGILSLCFARTGGRNVETKGIDESGGRRVLSKLQVWR